MAFSNYLIKVGNYEIPLSIIQADSYKAVRTVIDLDSYRDADGLLHRTALDHVPNKIEFNTIPQLTNTQWAEFFANIQKNFSEPKERKANVTFYVPETDSYVTQEMYMPDINFQIYAVWEKDNGTKYIKYDAIRLAFIGY